MELTNDFRVALPVERAWAVLTDVERIAPCLPGAQLQEIEGDEYRGIVKVKVGPITAQYKGQAKFLSLDPEAHVAVLRAEGRETRGQGNANATITATLTPDGEGTAVAIITDLTVTGRVAQFGRGVLADVSAKLLDQFVADLEKTVLVDEPATEPVEAVEVELEDPIEATQPDADEPGASPADRADPEPVEGEVAMAVAAHRGAAREAGRPQDRLAGAEARRPARHRRHAGGQARRPGPGGHRGALGPQEAADPQQGLTWSTRPTELAVEALLGRPVQGDFEVVVRHDDGSPVVLRNAPLLRDGTPMPTRYWLVGEPERTWISRLEAAGGVNRAEAEVDRPTRWPTPTRATPPSATPRSRRTTTAPARAAASAAPATASSASTPTTPGTSPAATTPSAAGSRPTSTRPGSAMVGERRDPAFIESIRPLLETYVRYFRPEVRGFEEIPDQGPFLVVGNHSGGATPPDLPILMTKWWAERGVEEPVYGLFHTMMIGMPGLGPSLHKAGALEAGWDNAEAVLGEGGIVIVYPGGDREALRPFADRDRIDFGDRKGFIRLALRAGVPIVPAVSCGAARHGPRAHARRDHRPGAPMAATVADQGAALRARCAVDHLAGPPDHPAAGQGRGAAAPADRPRRRRRRRPARGGARAGRLRPRHRRRCRTASTTSPPSAPASAGSDGGSGGPRGRLEPIERRARSAPPATGGPGGGRGTRPRPRTARRGSSTR